MLKTNGTDLERSPFIKRPLAFAAVVMLTACLCAAVADKIFMLVAGLAMFAILLFFRLKLGLKTIYFLFLLFFLFSYYHAKRQMLPLPTDSHVDCNTNIAAQAEGTVSQITRKDTYLQVILNDCHLELLQSNLEDGRVAEHIGLLVSASEFDAQEGDRVLIKGKLKAFSNARNEGNFDSNLYYRSIGIAYKINAASVNIESKNKNELLTNVIKFRDQMKNVYAQIATEHDAGILTSMMLGDNSELEEGVSRLYQSSGISHILAISGLHISLIGMTLYKLLRRFGLQYLPCTIASTILILCYGIMTGNGVSTQRAIVMFLMTLIADVIGRTYDTLSALSLSAIMMIYDNPIVITNCGFLLSFGAILGMTSVYPSLVWMMQTDKIKELQLPSALKKILTGSVTAFLMSLSINIVTMPILLYFFFSIPLYSVLLNLLVIPLSTILMLCALIAGITGMFSSFVGMFFIGISHDILMLYELLCNAFQQLPYSTLVLGRPTAWRIITYAGLLTGFIGVVIFLMARTKKSRFQWGPAAYSCVLIIMASAILIRRPVTGMEVNMIDVGQGDSIFVRTTEQVTYLFDGGSSDVKQVGKYRILPLLKSKAITSIDYAVISHPDTDHTNGILELLELMEEDRTFVIRNLVLPGISHSQDDGAYQELVNKAQEKSVPIIYANTGVDIGTETTSVRCLHPVINYAYSSTNDYSAVYLIEFGNFSMLMTGDVETAGENAMLAGRQLSDISVLKVAHHGSDSATSQAFLDNIKPELSLISCGINNKYGHPKATIINRLQAANSQIWQTTASGEIILTTDGKKLEADSKIKTNK